jgi:hypothetical protein
MNSTLTTPPDMPDLAPFHRIIENIGHLLGLPAYANTTNVILAITCRLDIVFVCQV